MAGPTRLTTACILHSIRLAQCTRRPPSESPPAWTLRPVENLVICHWNDLDALNTAFEQSPGQIAGVIMEPLLINTNFIFPREGYLEGVKEICERNGALLIFDEVITGFRVALGGAQELTGVEPDLATYAKSLAGGFPIAMLLGRPDIMEMLGDGTVQHGGSFNSNVMSIEAARALSGPHHGRQRRFLPEPGYSRDTTDGRPEASRPRIGVQPQGPRPRVRIFDVLHHPAPTSMTTGNMPLYCDEDKYQRFRIAMLERGIRISANGRWHMASTHTDEDVGRTVDAAKYALKSDRL